MTIKKIAVLTSGGDCSGLNSAIRGIVKRALQLNWEVYGIIEGTVGLLNRPLNYIKLDHSNTGYDLLKSGGTILRTVNKGDPFKYPMPDGTFKDRSMEIVNGYKELGIDAMIAIGGDGSMRIIEKLTALGNIKFIGIPKTIDNDVPFTEFPIGYITAVQTAVDSIEKLHDTAYSHQRIMVAEVMGRDVGHIALSSGIAGGADVILMPEIPYDFNTVVKAVKQAYQYKKYAIVVTSEAAMSKTGDQVFSAGIENKKYGGVGNMLALKLQEATGIDTRANILGHIQRGGSPVAFDRILGSSFGVHAVNLLNKGETRKVVGWLDNKVIDIDLEKLVNTTVRVEKDSDGIKTARGLGICLGDDTI